PRPLPLPYSGLVRDRTNPPTELPAPASRPVAPRVASLVGAAAMLAAAPVGEAQIFSSNEYGPDHWAAIGDGIQGTDGTVISMVTDEAGNVYVGGNFRVIGDVVANGIAKWDGRAWSALGSGMSYQVVCLAVSGTDLYAGGRFHTAGGVAANNVAKWDGQTWSALGEGIPGDVDALAVAGDTVYVGGDFSLDGGHGIAKWDGNAWSPLGSGTDDRVTAIEVDGTDVYIGGVFTTAGGVPANLVAKWDGTAWSSLGFDGEPGLNLWHQVRVLRKWKSDLYVGGNFLNAGDSGGDFIAKWDGQQWNSLGGGVDGRVRAITASGDALYVGGNFANAGGIETHAIARWDGQSWSALGSGFGLMSPSDWAVWSIGVSGGTVLAGGNLERAGGLPANHIARWDGTDWLTVGSNSGAPVFMGVNPQSLPAVKVSGSDIWVVGGSGQYPTFNNWNGVTWSSAWFQLEGGHGLDGSSYPMRSVEVSGSDFYVSGDFDAVTDPITDTSTPASCIAKWDGNAWSALGEGLDAKARVLVASGTDLYAGGDFTMAGGAAAHHIARWDGTQWLPLGGGVDGEVTAILVSGSDVHVAGEFSNAGGLPANRVARWNGVQWSALGTGLDSPAVDLVATGSGLYAAGHGGTAVVSWWDGTSWTTIGSAESGEIGQFPVLGVSGSRLCVVSRRFDDGMQTFLSEWDGGRWLEHLLDTGSFNRWNLEGALPGVAFANGSLYFSNQALTTGAGSNRNWLPDRKVSPLVSRLFLGNVPPLETGDGSTTVFFRGNPDQTSGVLPGRVHRIDRTTDFRTWETLDHRYAGETGGIDFTDPESPAGQAFYRAVPE
ncbi:MAG: hypothetical protein KDM81_09785, partial [Verrucomicrobiae bacterium]|nr:hypothetical protein [Verrucomicrobiae bacterium]